MEGLPINQLYGSDSLETAEKEIQYFFPPEQTLALVKPHVTREQRGKYLEIKLNVHIPFKSCEKFQTTQWTPISLNLDLTIKFCHIHSPSLLPSFFFLSLS